MNVMKHINHCYQTGNKKELARVKDELEKNLNEINVFFDEYLEVFDDKMSTSSNQNTPEWKAYNDKYKVYENMKHSLKMTDYYLGML